MQPEFRFKCSLFSFSLDAAIIYAAAKWKVGCPVIPYLIGAVSALLFIFLYREIKRKPVSKSSAIAAKLEEADRRLIAETVKSFDWCKEVSERISEFRKNRCMETATR